MSNRLIYIMSPSYSGSTLLTFMLANHPSISTIGELKASALGDVEQYDCSCGEKILECPFWRDVISESRNSNYNFTLDHFGTHFRSDKSRLADLFLRANVRGKLFETTRSVALMAIPACKSELSEILDHNRVLIDVVQRLQGGECFLDGSKDPVRLKHFLKSGIWDIKIISLVRDGRGVANSYMNHVGVGMDVAAREWNHKCLEMERVKSIIPAENLFNLKYEDLCTDTRGVLNRILVFAGLDAKALPDEIKTSSQHILGNAMRLRSLSEIKLDEKWKRMLSREALGVFDDIAGLTNRSLGYAE